MAIKTEDLLIDKAYYGYSNEKARFALSVLSDVQIRHSKKEWTTVEEPQNEPTHRYATDRNGSANTPFQDEVIIVDWTPAAMLEISLNEPDDFLKVRETLTRIGVASRKDVNRLYQSCHILHKQGRYFIVHFKELFLLDGKPSNLTENDIHRRNTITTLLSDWGLVQIIYPDQCVHVAPLRQIKIISHREKCNWELLVKYNIGNTKS